MVTVTADVATFRFFRPGAHQVFLVGEFDQWAQGGRPMVRTPEGYWVAALRLPPGNHRFRYRADNQWYADYAAFGIEYGPFGPDSVVHVEPSSDEPAKERTRA